MANPKTLEYFQADQEKANQIKDKVISELSEKDKQKFKVVEDAVKTLTDNNINFHLYALLPNSIYSHQEVIWQYNSLTALAKYDNAGKLTQESLMKISKFCAGMLAVIFNDTTTFKLSKEVNFEDRWKCFQEYLWNCLKQYYDYLNKWDVKNNKK